MAQHQETRRSVRFLREWLVPQWRWFLLGALFSAITAAAAFGYPTITSQAVEWLEVADERVFTVAPIVIVVLVIVRGLSLYGQTQANNFGVQRAMVKLQEALFGRLMDGDFSRLQASASGAFVSQFANDMVLIREASLRVATNLMKSVLTVIACIGYMLWSDWLLTVVVFVVYPIAFWPVLRMGARIRKVSIQSQQQAGEVTAFLGEAFQGARTIKAFGLEDYEKARASKGFLERARLYMRILRSKALVDPFLEFVGGLAMAGLFAFAGWRAMSGQTALPDLIGFITAIGVASPELRALGTLNAVVNEGLAAADRTYAAMDAESKIVDRSGAMDMKDAKGRIELDNVAFGYPGAGPAIMGLSLTAEPGETIALVGPSGAGKSTVFNLLLRLYDPDAGAVRLDGHDVRELQIASLRRQVALVSQDAFLFDATIKENIALGRRDATDDDIRAAAAAAACDFIEGLPRGWDTQVGEAGRNLSGGQRQRVALARALISHAPVLLLDEATSALDSDSESRVQTALASLAGRKTILVIAHRLATVRRADRIFVIDHGRVVESGSHEDLIALGGAYARLSAQQLI